MEQEVYQLLIKTACFHWYHQGRKKIINPILTRFFPKKDSSKKLNILEVGCGAGHILPLLSQWGKVHATESDHFAFSFVKKEYSQFDIIHHKIPDPLPPHLDKKYDLIVLSDVLEHIKDDREALDWVKKYIKPSGSLLICVPSYQWLWSIQDIKAHHYRRYTKKNLKRLLKSTGFYDIQLSYCYTFFFPIIALYRLYAKFTGHYFGFDASIQPKWLNSLLIWILGLEGKLMKWIPLPFGDEIHGIFRLKL